MEKLLSATAIIVLLWLSVTTAFVMAEAKIYNPNDKTPSISAWMNSNAWKQNETTIFVNICSESMNPECKYGDRYKVPYANVTVTISLVQDNIATAIITQNYTTTQNGYLAIPLLVDHNFESHAYYSVDIASAEDTKKLGFWTHEKHY